MTLTTTEADRLADFELTIKNTAGAFVACGKALAGIKAEKLYRLEFSTFEEYCQQKWGWGHERARLLIESAEVVEDLPKRAQSLITNEGQARALAKVAPEKRVEVLKEAAKTGSITAKKIENLTALKSATIVAVTKERNGKTEEVVRDETGYAIPPLALPFWNRRGEVEELLSHISAARSPLRKLDPNDEMYVEAHVNDVLSDLNHAYNTLRQGVPHAVCPTCQGRTPKTCQLCKGRGMISKFLFDSAIPEDLKAIRAKMCVNP